MDELIPGFTPYDETTAAAHRDQIERRAGTMIAPYFQRAIDAQLKARDDREGLEATYEAAGMDPEEAIARTDWEASAYLCATIEVLTDLMHTCTKRGVDFHGALVGASQQHHQEERALTRFLAYGALPEEPPKGRMKFLKGGD